MKVFRGYRTELRLNLEKRTMCLKSAGTARFAYNWGLRTKIDEYKRTGSSPNAMQLHRRLNALKKTEFSWMCEVSKCCAQEALRDLDRAFALFFRRLEQGKRPGFPRYRSKRMGVGSFRLTGSIRIEEHRIKLPRLGWLKLKERGYLPTEAHVLSVTVKERAGRWFVSVLVEEEIPDVVHPGGAVGVDVGIASLAVLSDGTVFDNPRAMRRVQSRLRLLHKSVSRKRKGSHNHRKALMRLSRQHYKVACIRKDAIHKASSVITKRFGLIGIESLNVQVMLKNRRLSFALSDAGLSELLRQIRYKSSWRGCSVVEADRFYPSSKTCSGCGAIKNDLDLGERVFRCDACNLQMDRDLNAAINLREMAVSSTVTACGGTSGGGIPLVRESTSHVSMKQEAETECSLQWRARVFSVERK